MLIILFGSLTIALLFYVACEALIFAIDGED